MTALALDTNILLLWIVGVATGRVLGKRLKAYSDADLSILQTCIEGHDRLVVTPNVWTEVSNVWDFGIDGSARRTIQQVLSSAIQSSLEISKASREIAVDPDFDRLGLADCAWLAVLDQDTTLLTDDVALCDTAVSRGLKAVNFTRLRDFN
jgi:hypothetical protein